MISEEPTVAAIRVWLEEPDLCVSYERLGITVGTLRLRREAASAGVQRAIELLPNLNENPDIETGEVGTIKEFLSMVSEVLAGSSGQILPLHGGGLSMLGALFESPS